MFYSIGKVLVCLFKNIFYENEVLDEVICFGINCVLFVKVVYIDVKLREVVIVVCFLVLIIGIGLYFKIVIRMYDVKIVVVNI